MGGMSESNTTAGVPPIRLVYMTPAELEDNPRNWRTHPETQLAALSAAIGEVGWAGVCLFNERTGRLIDGHLRKKLALRNGIEQIPVLVGNWSEEDEAKILVTLDPLSAMAEADAGKLEELIASVQTESPALREMLDDLLAGEKPKKRRRKSGSDGPETPGAGSQYGVIVICRDEEHQKEIFEMLQAQQLECRVVVT